MENTSYLLRYRVEHALNIVTFVTRHRGKGRRYPVQLLCGEPFNIAYGAPRNGLKEGGHGEAYGPKRPHEGVVKFTKSTIEAVGGHARVQHLLRRLREEEAVRKTRARVRQDDFRDVMRGEEVHVGYRLLDDGFRKGFREVLHVGKMQRRGSKVKRLERVGSAFNLLGWWLPAVVWGEGEGGRGGRKGWKGWKGGE
jgi:hypothetical protein